LKPDAEIVSGDRKKEQAIAGKKERVSAYYHK
jgi:hypothetical protein